MHITIIDDERILGSKIKKKLESEWYAVSNFYSYQGFMKNGDGNSHLYIVDISLGDGSGFDIIDWLRNAIGTKVPIMIMSWYGDSEKIIYWLNIGADDYLTKPFVPDELIARIKALLRRPIDIIPNDNLIFKNIVFNPESREIRVKTNRVYLTFKEKRLLEFFMREQWKIVSREKLITYAWWGNHIWDITDNTINATLSKLRKKIWEDFSLVTIYKHGYILE